MARVNLLLAALLCLCFRISPAVAAEPIDPSSAKAAGEMLFYDVRAMGVEGQGWTDVAAPFDRFPSKAQATVREAVWKLSRDSAGLSVRFVTDAQTICGRWSLTSASLAMPHMPATGVSGLDLYVKLPDGRWHWLAVGRPTAQNMSATLIGNLPPGQREYMLYLPLYNGVSSVEIGIPKTARMYKADPRPLAKSKPIAFYGTSIMQGGCASRPGMCHTAILGRRLDRPVINLGFSGNGKMEPEVGALLAELDPAIYVIDCLPNMDGKTVAERAEPLVAILRKAHPVTPIVLVEDRTYPDGILLERKHLVNVENRAALKKVYDHLVTTGDKHLAYVTGDKLLSPDGDDTVDGSHPTDLGFEHQADAMQAVLEPLLGKP